MPSISMKVFSVCCMLSSSLCSGIIMHNSGASAMRKNNESSCPCLNWSDMYYFPINGTEHVIWNDHVDIAGLGPNGTTLVINESRIACDMLTLPKEYAFGGLDSPYFCAQTLLFRENYCWSQTWGLGPDDPDVSKCWISADCAKTTGPAGKVLKTCSAKQGDRSLSDLRLSEMMELIKKYGMDPGVLSLYGTRSISGPPGWDGKFNSTIYDILDMFRERSPTTAYMGMAGMFDPRWWLRGEELYLHTFNYTSGTWDVTCERGCPAE